MPACDEVWLAVRTSGRKGRERDPRVRKLCRLLGFGLLGVTHAERNGHHYVDGFGETPAREAERFLAAHPDLYERSGGKVRLAIHDGDLLTGSLTAPGFASAVHPDWSTIAPLARPKTILRERTA